jgi:hypothetical protein
MPWLRPERARRLYRRSGPPYNGTIALLERSALNADLKFKEISMVDRASVEKVVKDAYAARAAKDLDAIARIFKPDAVFHMVGSPATFPGAIRAEGHAQLVASLMTRQ